MQFLKNLYSSKEFKIKIIDRNNKKHSITSRLLTTDNNILIGETLKDILISWYASLDQSNVVIIDNKIIKVANWTDKIAIEKSFGICGGFCACGSCHVYVNKKLSSILPKMNKIEEATLKNFAVKLEDTSRLACQLIITEECNNQTFTIAEPPAEETYGYLQHEIELEDQKQS